MYVKAADPLQRERSSTSVLFLLKKFLEYKAKIPKEKVIIHVFCFHLCLFVPIYFVFVLPSFFFCWFC
jgi:hypothetical protein